MNWDREPFVKVYTRDTPEFLAMSWQARCLLYELIRKVDRDGVMKVGKYGLDGVAVAIRATPAEIRPHLEELVSEGRLVLDSVNGLVIIPNHRVAQETRSSDAMRQKWCRERKKDREEQALSAESNAISDQQTPYSVTGTPDGSIENVTASHTASQKVTNRREEIRLDKIRLELTPPKPPEGGAPVGLPRKSERRETSCPDGDVGSAEVLAWAKRWGIPTDHSEFPRFLASNQAKGRRYELWGRAWDNWLLNAPMFAPSQTKIRAVPIQEQPSTGPRWVLPKEAV